MAGRGQYKLTTFSKLLILLLIVVLAATGVFFGLKSGKVKTKNMEKLMDADGNVINTEKTSEDTINLSLDEWIGWKEIIDANGGLTTQPGSIYDELGINVNISIIYI